MGSWDVGIFDDDDAAAFLGETVNGLVIAIEEDLAVLDDRKKRSTYAGSRAIAGVACLRALAKTIETTKVCLRRSQVMAWRDTYLEWFDRCGAAIWRDDESAREYRHGVAREFRLLINRLEEWEDWGD